MEITFAPVRSVSECLSIVQLCPDPTRWWDSRSFAEIPRSNHTVTKKPLRGELLPYWVSFGVFGLRCVGGFVRPCVDLMPACEHRAAAPTPPGGGTAARSLSKNGKSSTP